MTPPERRSPLHDRHKARGAKFASFGGWRMPLEYAGGGVLKEHAAVREAVGVFDVSHLGKATVHGEGAAAFVNRCLTNDLDRIGVGQAQYTLCCDEEIGGVVDDLIVYRFGDDRMFLVPNAANTEGVVRRLAEAAPREITVVDQHEEYAMLAVQGPRSPHVLEVLGLPGGHQYMSFVEAMWEGSEIVVSRTGYTGEHGYELVAPAGAAARLWEALMTAGVQPCGLGARDTLRTEMGYPLHGQDLSLSITPVEARLGWAVGWKKPRFWGRAALVAEREAGARRVLWGLEAQDRGIARPGMLVLRMGVPAGEVTSGTFSPTRRIGIALALLEAKTPVVEGEEVQVDVRGRMASMKVVKPPFVPSSPR
jgi:aminomethyltransferase